MQSIAIIGFGFMGTMHAQIYAQLRDARLVAVVDYKKAKAKRDLAKLKLDVPVFGTLEEMLAATDVDVVDICLPTDLHAPFAFKAIAAGKHVFCEKPLALKAADGRRIAFAAKKAGVFLQVGQCIRFWPEYQAFEVFVKSGKAGKLLSLSLQRRVGRTTYSVDDWLNDGDRSGGGALDLHIHDTDFVHHLLGKPDAVTSVGTRDKTGWSHIFTTYHFKSVAVTAEGGWNYPVNWGFQMAFQAVFERGTVEFDSGASPTLCMSLGKGKKQPLPYRTPGAGESKTGGGNLSSLGGYYNELAAFISCLENKRAPKIATGDQAADSLATALAEIQSAATGRTIKL
ncbi:MAG: Gfo/Idh/MocA family oxidoreductase [Verrucomicrobia bacterium]|jgi:predicted dehydrogenase|nr:Gfo/Idh/MocA family oxidoreductase [Verrucomicrobiota bacterium]